MAILIDDVPAHGHGKLVCTNAMLLIEYALSSQVEELFVRAYYDDHNRLALDERLISRHLRTLHLEWVKLESTALNFSDCPVLEDLKMEFCRIRAREMFSKSLKHLRITLLCSLPIDYHMRIYAPSLISLQLMDFFGLPPFLVKMPLLVTASVYLFSDPYYLGHRNSDDCDYARCGCRAYPVDEGVLLDGLSNAVNLELRAEAGMPLYRWDLEWCPIFGKLKVLFLNEWFTAINLVCILKHSPVLEMLTLQLRYTKNLVGVTRAQETTEQSTVSPHIKFVNIECEKVEEGVHQIMKILSTCGILKEQINIKHSWSSSNFFS